MDSYETKMSDSPRYMDAKSLLKKYFGYDTFKPLQYKVIDRILDLKNCLAIFPTGYGKSMLFQLPSLISNELAIIVSPLIALMQDQHESMERVGIRSCCYNSTLTLSEKNKMTRRLIDGEYQILYITPESLTRSFELLDAIYSKQGICMICIDEAHCISSYGYDFRPSYMEIKQVFKLLPNVPVLAVTATATDRVIRDIQQVLGIGADDVIRASFDRANLKIFCRMQNKKTEQTMEQIFNLIKNDEPTIVYCLTKTDTEKIAEYLTESGIICEAYHAGLKNSKRKAVQEDFMESKINCISATIAFGMGINKQNIRKVIHYGCPQNIESYYQEIGRAGRDGKESECWLLYKERDFIVQKRFIDGIANQQYKFTRLQLLQVIVRYVGLKTCYRQYILKYFGEDYPADNCMMCGNCLSDGKRIISVDHHKIIQVVYTVADLGNSYGVNTIGLVLKGSGAKKITQSMKRTMYYSEMKNIKIEDIGNIIHDVLAAGYLESHDIGNMVHVLRVTPKGTTYIEKLINTIL